jgi:hypothetical protein
MKRSIASLDGIQELQIELDPRGVILDIVITYGPKETGRISVDLLEFLDLASDIEGDFEVRRYDETI